MRIEDVKIGMRVKSKTSLFGLTIGQEGTVRVLNPLTNPSTIAVGVEFDEYVGGHSIGGIINKFTGCWLIADWIEPVISKPERISTQGKTTSVLYAKRNNMDIIYKIGDRVRLKSTKFFDDLVIRPKVEKGDMGTIRCFIPTNHQNIGVEFDKQCLGHTIDGNCEFGKGWYLSSSDIKLVKDSKSIDNKPVPDVVTPNRYTFKTSNLSIDKVTEDALQDGTIAFILIGEKNAIVGVLQCHECEREALYRLQDSGTYFPKYEHGEFVTPKTVEEWGTFEGAFFFSLISKDKIGRAKEILKEIKRKDVIRKELIDYKIKEQTNINGNKRERFSVLTF